MTGEYAFSYKHKFIEFTFELFNLILLLIGLCGFIPICTGKLGIKVSDQDFFKEIFGNKFIGQFELINKADPNTIITYISICSLMVLLSALALCGTLSKKIVPVQLYLVVVLIIFLVTTTVMVISQIRKEHIIDMLNQYLEPLWCTLENYRSLLTQCCSTENKCCKKKVSCEKKDSTNFKEYFHYFYGSLLIVEFLAISSVLHLLKNYTSAKKSKDYWERKHEKSNEKPMHVSSRYKRRGSPDRYDSC